MEEKIINAMDTLDIRQTDELLNGNININMNIDSATIKRIRKSLFNKAGLKRSRNIIQKGLTFAAAVVVLVMLSIVTMGVDNVANAFSKLFSFIPGYAIVENNTKIEYVIEKQNIIDENSDVSITVKNAIATKNNISISLELEKKNFNESKLLEEKQKEWEAIEKGGQLTEPTILLLIDGIGYKMENFSIGGGGKTYSIMANFLIDEKNISPQTVYKLEYKDYNLSLDFKLKDYDSFNSLEEIGPTSTLNDISITAVTKWTDKKLEVELYSTNKSKYRINSFTKAYDNGYEGKKLNLQTSGGIKDYTTPGSSMGANNKFFFDISGDKKNLVLKIPYLIVESDENQNISLKIPKKGEKIILNEKVKFNDCTMIITEVERIISDGNEYGALRINMKYENSDKNKVMCNAKFRRINLLGIIQGGGYSSTPDQNDIMKSVDFNLEKDEDSILKLKIENPEYYLVGEYSFELK